eukprot:TRINITY_DN15647_c0_g1_i2.p1 TRINITY_DN15647_c0_g1~~TRINITY_DN15647_c0_g1_i2.p1  ORF type:complete len:1272 (-),score=202.48 TRINITY_DN15647_c0_g1_i2:157-3909(-)
MLADTDVMSVPQDGLLSSASEGKHASMHGTATEAMNLRNGAKEHPARAQRGSASLSQGSFFTTDDKIFSLDQTSTRGEQPVLADADIVSSQQASVSDEPSKSSDHVQQLHSDSPRQAQEVPTVAEVVCPPKDDEISGQQETMQGLMHRDTAGASLQEVRVSGTRDASSIPPLSGFSTAGGQKLTIDPAALRHAQAVLADNDVEEVRQSTVSAKPHAVERCCHFEESHKAGGQSESSNNIAQSGFSTAGGRKINVDQVSVRRAQAVLADADVVPEPLADVLPDCQETGHGLLRAEMSHGRQSERSRSANQSSEVCPNVYHIPPSISQSGFSTAGGRTIKVDQAALLRAQAVLADSADLPPLSGGLPSASHEDWQSAMCSDMGDHHGSTSRTTSLAHCRTLTVGKVALPSAQSVSADVDMILPLAGNRDSLIHGRSLEASQLTHDTPRAAPEANHSGCVVPLMARAVCPAGQVVAHCQDGGLRGRFVDSAEGQTADFDGGWAALFSAADRASEVPNDTDSLQAEVRAALNDADIQEELEEDEEEEARYSAAYEGPPRVHGHPPSSKGGLSFERFRREIEATYGASAPRAVLDRFGRQWFDIQRRQLAMSWVMRRELTGTTAVARSELYYRRLVRRCGAELSGGRSAFRRLSEDGPAWAAQHMVVMCSHVYWPSFPVLPSEDNNLVQDNGAGTDAGGAVRTIEVSDGWYFLSAKLDAGLSWRVRSGHISPGRRIRICLSKAEGIPEGGCDPLELPDGAHLQLAFDSCLPIRATQVRLGLQPRIFPPVRIADLCGGGGTVPFIDVVVLRMLPLVFRSWTDGKTAPEERSFSQECERAEKVFEDGVARAEEEMEAELEEDGVRENEDAILAVASRARARRLAVRDAASLHSSPPQQLAVVLDAQQIGRPQDKEWWSSLALLSLPGMAPSDDGADESNIQPFDRIRATGVRPGKARPPLKAGSSSLSGLTGACTAAAMAEPPLGSRRGPLRLYYDSRSSRLQFERAASDVAMPPGLAAYVLPTSPFFCRSGSLPVLQAPAPQVPLPDARGHFCDLVGALLRVSEVESATPAGSLGRWRAVLPLLVLTPSQRLCRVLVEDYSADREQALSGLQRARASFAAIVGHQFTTCPGVGPTSIAASASETPSVMLPVADCSPREGSEAAPGERDGANSRRDGNGHCSPVAVALENVTFDWHERRTGVIHFLAQRVHLRLSRRPASRYLREALASASWAPCDIERAKELFDAAAAASSSGRSE